MLPTGLTADGLYVLQSALEYGVKLAGVNIMTMDYGDGAAPNPQGQMGTYAIDAAESLFAQLRTLYGPAPTNAQLWQMVGVTPMIGLNDVTSEIFDLAAAAATGGLGGAAGHRPHFDVVAEPRPGKSYWGDRLRR